MTKTSSTIGPQEIVDRYVAAWNEPDSAARRQAVAALWIEDGVEFVEGVQFAGRAGLHARLTEAYETFVGPGKYAVTRADDVAVHDDLVTFTIQLTEDGAVAWEARVFLLLTPHGLIREDYHLTVKPLPTE